MNSTPRSALVPSAGFGVPPKRIFFVCVLLLLTFSFSAHAQKLSLVGGTVINPADGKTIENAVLVIDGEKIESVASRREAGWTNPFVFVVGCPRSGTTLLQRLLDAHPALAICDETFWVPYFFKKRLGLTPDGGNSAFLPALIGRGRAMELLLTNRTLSGAEALEWGLVGEVVEPIGIV